MFFRRHTDGTRITVPLQDQYAGPRPSPCWIIGGGASLSQSVANQILATPAPRFTVNLAGSGLLRPHFWTSYDPTVRFHRSIYLDASVTKFVHLGRAMDLVPETPFKVCDCPALYFFDRDPQRGFYDFPRAEQRTVTDWQDSMIQAIDIAYRLGFRELYLIGCEMLIPPSVPLRQAARRLGVSYQHGELLGEFVNRCEFAGLPRGRIEEFSSGPQYHFDEQKPLSAAIQTDFHYFRVVEYLRLSGRALALAGLRLFNVTPRSRLRHAVPALTLRQACRRINALTGNPAEEPTRGRYTDGQSRQPRGIGPMRDFRPHFWPAVSKSAATPSASTRPKESPSPPAGREQGKSPFDDLPEIPVDLNEVG
jgi:hypothetical protein